MSDARKPTRETFDAELDVLEVNGMVQQAYVLLKYTYSLHKGEAQLAEPEALLHDFRDSSKRPILTPGTDFWPTKYATDFVVVGSAYAPGGNATRSMEVSARFGRVEKRIAVFGKRELKFLRDGTPVVAAPEAFETMPITWEHAYGGLDLRVAPERELDTDGIVAIATGGNHPGFYPRNFYGKGYVVYPSPGASGLELPNLEDPRDLLGPSRLVVGAPEHWWKQPLPACFAWLPLTCWPRKKFLGPGADAWFPGPEDDQMPEVRRGHLPRNYRAWMAQEATATGHWGVHPRFWQEASPDFVFDRVEGTESFEIRGMHPELDVVRATLPTRKPRVVFTFEGQHSLPELRLHSVVVFPAEQKLQLVWGAVVDLPRYFLLGVHKHIPLSVTVDGTAPLQYEASRPFREVAAEAQNRSSEL